MKSFFKAVSQNILVVLLVLGIVVAINMISYKYSARFDLTADNEYTLSQATHTVLGKLEDRLLVKLYYSNDLPAVLLPLKQRVGDLLSEMKAASQEPIIIEFVDPDSNEDKEQEAIATGMYPLQLNIVEKDKREVKKVFMGMAVYYQDKKQVIPSLAQVQNLEYQLDLRLLKLVEKSLPQIGVLSGNPQKFQGLKQLVGQMGEFVELTPEQEQWPNGLKAIVIAEPRELNAETLKKIDGALAKGVNVAVFTSGQLVDDAMQVSDVDSGMQKWLEDKGIGFTDRLLLDTFQNEQAGFMAGMMQVYMPYPFWVRAFRKDLSQEHAVTSEIEEVLLPWTHGLVLDQKSQAQWQPHVLARSSERSFLQAKDQLTVSPQYVQQMTELPVFQSYPLVVELAKPQKAGAGKLTVAANSHMIQDSFLQQSASNVLFLENTLEHLSWGDVLIGIRSRGKTHRPLAEISAATKSLIKWGHMVVIPVTAVFFGVLILWVLKRLRQQLIAKIQSVGAT